VSQAMWPNTDKRRLLMKSITGGMPVRADISAFMTCTVRSRRINFLKLREIFPKLIRSVLHVRNNYDLNFPSAFYSTD